MATKTVVCPECGSPATPGRFACSECGSLLASLGGSAQPWTSGRGLATATSTPGVPPTSTPGVPPTSTRPAVPASPARAADVAQTGEWPDPVAGRLTSRPAVAADPFTIGSGDASAIAVDRPAAARRPRPKQPPRPRTDTPRATRRAAIPNDPVALELGLVEPTNAATKPPTDGGSAEDARPGHSSPTTAAATPVTPVTPAAATPVTPVTPAALAPMNVAQPQPPRSGMAAARPMPAWPPLDDVGPVPQPPARALAGAYLAPSAVLPPLDAPRSGDPAPTRGTRAAQHGRSAATDNANGSRGVSLGDSLDALGITADMPRRLVGIGAGVAALGFVLPWVNGLGGNAFADYTSRWGLAGPAHWLVVAVLVAVVLVANAGGVIARLPVAVPAVALAALLVGLVWPYVFGAGSSAVGVWTVLAGAIVLLVGGVLATRRHEPLESPV